MSSSGTMPMTLPAPLEALELAGRSVEKMLHADSQHPALADKLRIGCPASLSGLQEPDYPSGAGTVPGVAADSSDLASLRQMSSVQKTPLPAELVEHFGHMQSNCMMGLFPEISRAWLTIDSDLYVWRLEDCGDLAYFDGLGDTILSVALLHPKQNIFKSHIKHLLCLTTAVEIVLLGVSFAKVDGDHYGEMHLLPEPLFALPTDSTYMPCVVGSQATGRIFLGGRDGCLYEFAYRADEGWFGKKASKINHSTSSLSFLVPSFVAAALYDEDSLEQIVVDDSRGVLYTRSEKGVIQVFDLGTDGQGMNRVASLSQGQIVQEAARVASNIDKSNFAPLVGISIISLSESIPLSLMAISANGVRFYFSTGGAGGFDRPSGLNLLHVRLPPGFSASSPVPKPSKVHMSYYHQGTLLLCSAQSDDSDLVWLLSSDPFPFQPMLMECQTTLPLPGRVWALDELPRRSAACVSATPHLAPARRFALVSSHGTHVVTKLRPVDRLRRLLIDRRGPECDAVRAFFTAESAQAAATCLALAASRAPQDAHVAEWATKAFFLYGGEPQLVFPRNQQQQPQQSMLASPSFHPHLASTPAPVNLSATSPMPFSPGQTFVGNPQQPQQQQQQQQQQQPMIPEMHFSAKHNGLYLYLSRLLRPVWLSTLVTPGSKDVILSTTVEPEEIDWIMSQLNDLKAFLDRNAQFTTQGGPTPALGTLDMTSMAANMTTNLQQKSQQEALLRERQSLLFLQHLVAHSLQVLGLWKVVCDHQFHVVAASLPLEEQNMLRGMYFRDLMISAPGRELCNRLVQAIIQRYLNDNASTDAISRRLREVCPTLYQAEDAISSKAHELLACARQRQTDDTERQRMLTEAVRMCKEVAARINLDVLVSHLAAVHCYEGAVEVALAAAAKRDPQRLGLHYYKNGEPIDDQQGMQAFLSRMSCYKHVLGLLHRLFDASCAHPMTPNVPRSPGPPPPPDPNSLSPAEAGQYAEVVMKVGLASDDELFHVALYQWLAEQGQYDRLLSVRTPFLEDFLTRGTKKQPEAILMFDLLWKHYEKNKSYAAAAKILSKLADRHSTEINLKQRLEYLSRAIVCMKSGEVSTSSSGRVAVGELLHDLEEKMEVARIQLKIAEAISALVGRPNREEALARLNGELLDISQLYTDFAEPFQLWECQLGILQCAGHHDPPLVETLWENIIEEELHQVGGQESSNALAVVTSKAKALAKVYATSQKYFPLEFIIRKLELLSCQAQADHGGVFNSLLSVSIPLPKLLETYNRLYMSNDPMWLTKGAPNHLLHVLAKILETFASSPSLVPYNERRPFTVVCLDAVGQYLGKLYAKPDSDHLVRQFRGIQAKLERL